MIKNSVRKIKKKMFIIYIYQEKSNKIGCEFPNFYFFIQIYNAFYCSKISCSYIKNIKTITISMFCPIF